jgi:hypothetical protein
MVNAFTKSIIGVFAAVLSLTVAGEADAATTATWTTGDIGDSRTVTFDGYSQAYHGGADPVPGLSASLKLTLDSIVANHWTFTYDLTNTSTSPIDSSRVTVFGFDVLQPYAGVTSTGLFNDPGAGSTPHLGNHNLCLRTITAGQCTGSFFGGVAKGSSASGLLNLKYTAAQLQLQFDHFFVGYQGVSSKTLCLCHQDAVGTGAVPEPSTWAMLITGVGAVGLVSRRRRVFVRA